MNSLFEDLKEGLQEAIEFEKGRISAKKTTYMIAPVKEFNPSEIRTIRTAAGMTQTIFACYMGVSKKTVEAWEAGRSHPPDQTAYSAKRPWIPGFGLLHSGSLWKNARNLL